MLNGPAEQPDQISEAQSEDISTTVTSQIDLNGSGGENRLGGPPTSASSAYSDEEPSKSRSTALVAELKHQLKVGDPESCLRVCQSLAELFQRWEVPDNPAIFNDLFNASFSIKQYLKKFSPQGKLVLVRAIFHLSENILRYPRIKLEDRFLANYNYYWCAKNYPPILNRPEYTAEVKKGLQAALVCVDLLIPALNLNGSFRSSRLTSHSFWHRVAQLNLAYWSLGLAGPDELPSILETAVAALKRIVQFGVGMSEIAVQHNRARLASCLDWLGMLYAQKKEWRHSNLYYIESDAWFAEIARADPAKKTVCRHAFLAEFYFAQQEFALAFEHALIAVADDTANSRTELQEGSFHYFLERLLLFGGSDPTDFLLDLIATGLPPVSNLRALSALVLNAVTQVNWVLAEATQWLFVMGAEQLEVPEIVAVPAEKRYCLITSRPTIVDFFRDCESKINGGEAASQIDLLTKLVAGSKTIAFGRKESPVLLSLLARAHARIGDHDSALPLLTRLLEVDKSEENQAITLYLLGDVHLARDELKKAAHVYEASFRVGHHHAALFKAALARTCAGQFDKGISHLKSMLSVANPNKDEAPHQTRTVLAQAYWGRYCLDEESGGKNDEDIEAACEALREVLTGKVGALYVHDAEAISRLVEMISHPIAVTSIAELLRNTWDARLVTLFSNALGRRHAYPRIIIETALERLSDAKLWDEVKRGFVSILAKALARSYHYGEIDGLTFEELATLIVTQFRRFPAVGHQEWLCELLLIEQHASKAELIERYADEAIKIFAPISGAPEDAIRALSDPGVLTPINDFLLRRMPPATEPLAYGHTDSADLYELVKEFIDELRVEFQEPIEGGSILTRSRRNEPATVSLMNWLDRIRPFLLNLLDIPRHEQDYSARGPLATLAEEASPWTICFAVVGSRIDISLQFNRIDPLSNPTLLLEQAEQRLKTECELAAVKDLVQLDLGLLELDHRIDVTVRVPRPIQISREFAPMRGFVNYMKNHSARMLSGGLADPASYHRASILFASAFQHVRQTETEKWVEFIRHLLDLRYVTAASWLLFLPLEGDDTGKHPRSIVHDLKKKVQLAMLKQEQGNEVTSEELAELRNSQFRLASNILFALRDNFYSMRRIWLKGEITKVVNEFSKKLPDLQFSVFCPPDAYARIHRELFSRVMFNLLHNAITAALATEIRVVEVRVVKDDPSWVTISVMNKYNPERPGSQTGTGIGLEEVKYFIGNLSRGKVKVRKDKDEFEVTLLLPDVTNISATHEHL